MKNDWIDIELGKICQKVSKVNRRDVEENATFQYLDIGGIDNKANKIISTKSYSWSIAPSRAQQIVDVDDILFSTVRTYLRNIAKVEDKSLKGQICSTGFTVIRAKKDAIIPSYLFAYVLYEGFLQPLSELQTGSSYPAVRDRDVFSQKIPFPPLPEQRAIVSKIEELFSELDHSIASFKAAKAKLEIYRQAVLKKAFEGGFTEIWREIHSKSSSSWLFENLAELTTKITDGEHFRPKTQDSGIFFLSAKDVRDDGVDFSDPLFISKETAEKALKRCNPERGDILIVSRGATVGRMCIVKNNEVFCLLGSVILLKVKEGVNPNFLSYYLKSPTVNRKIISVSGSTAQQAIYLRDIKNIELSVPTLEEQFLIVQEIETRLSVADKLAETIEINLKKSEALRQSILKKAFEGKLLSEAELDACRKEADWEPAEKLLERIKSEKKTKS